MISGGLGAHMEHDEALLFRLLTSFFGKESVIFGMSALAACGGSLPKMVSPQQAELMTLDWAKKTKCLFTIIDDADEPKLVIDFEEDTADAIDVSALEAKTRLPSLLGASGVKYVLVPKSDFYEIVDPTTALTFPKYLHARLIEDFGVE